MEKKRKTGLRSFQDPQGTVRSTRYELMPGERSCLEDLEDLEDVDLTCDRRGRIAEKSHKAKDTWLMMMMSFVI